MKILVVSLLRVGDLLQQVPLLQGLRRKYAQAEIHLLMNRQCEGISDFLNEFVDETHFFEREQYLQRVSAHSSVKERILNVGDCLSRLPDFDVVYNFSHTRLSVDVISALSTQETKGLHRNSVGVMDLQNNRWLQYYNECFSGNRKSFFHGNEILSQAFDIPVPKLEIEFRPSGLIAFQCFTSDPKKNWPLAKFNALKKLIVDSYPNCRIQVLCAEQDKEALLEYFTESEIAACSFSEAFAILKEAKALISVDTSIKHLGALAKTPIVEINLGGSDVVKTGAYAVNTWNIHAEIACYPCMHSQKCSQNTHICSENISVEKVFSLFQELMESKSYPQSESIYRAAWSSYLSLKSNGQNQFFERDAFRVKRLAKITEELEASLQSIQLEFEKSHKELTTEVLMPSLLLLREALQMDKGNYFGSLKDVFTESFVDSKELFSKVFKELAKAKALVRLHLQLINELDQDGYREAHDAP